MAEKLSDILKIHLTLAQRQLVLAKNGIELSYNEALVTDLPRTVADLEEHIDALEASLARHIAKNA